MSGYQGNIIIKNPATPAGPYEDGAAPGVWTLSEAMRFTKQGVWPTAGLASPDPYFKNVSLLLHGNGTNGAQNNTFTNSATGGGVSADQGIPIQGSFSPYGSNWSNYFDGSGDYLSAPSNAAFAYGTGNFTVELWFFASSVSGAEIPIYKQHNSGAVAGDTVEIRIASSKIYGYIENTSFGGTTTLSPNTWYHVAYVRNGSTCTLYLNGVSEGSASNSLNISTNPTTVRLGTNQVTANFFTGYISNARVVKGTAVYTSNFTPSTIPLTAITNTSLLTCQSNRFRDASSNNFTITRNGDTKVLNLAPFAPSAAYSTTTNGGSAYFDPNNLDRLNINFNYFVGNTDFTWEGWAYLTTTDSPKPLFSGKIGGSNIGFDLLFENGGRALIIITQADDVITVAAASNINLHCWNHIALSRTSGTLSVYVNGVQTYNAGFAGSMLNSFNLRIGGTYDYYGESWYYFPGYLSDIRYSKTGRYSGTTITVPTAPLTNDANTLGLLNFTNAGIFDNSMHNNLRTVGNAQISTSVKKFGTGSIAFDGSGDYLVSNGEPIKIGSGNFTIEFWVYFNAVNNGTVKYLYDFRTGAATSASFLAQEANNTWTYWNGAGSSVTTGLSGSTFATGQWYHVAITRSSNVLYFFVNGSKVSSDPADSSTYATSTITIGARYSGSNSLNGYIDDLRITNGVARYTANFTPPTKAFPDT